MVWDRLRRRDRGDGSTTGLSDQYIENRDAYDILEEAPVAALVLDGGLSVVAANAAARAIFLIDAARLPQSLLMVTREARLEEALRDPATAVGDVRLIHHQRTLRLSSSAGVRPDETVVFLADVTELRRLEMVRQEFVANLSHELKTPLTSLRLAAESLQAEVPLTARRRFADRVLKETDQLAAIVDNLRQLAEIEAGHSVIAASRFELCELVSETISRLHIERPLNVKIVPDLWVETDRPKLAQALGNLLDNAVKFSPPASAIDVKAKLVNAELVIKVRDRGAGISPEHWARVFERFYKVDPARSREMPGSGLGLAITKHLVLALGGRVWTAAARGGGQVFSLAIPAGSVNETISGP